MNKRLKILITAIVMLIILGGAVTYISLSKLNESVGTIGKTDESKTIVLKDQSDDPNSKIANDEKQDAEVENTQSTNETTDLLNENNNSSEVAESTSNSNNSESVKEDNETKEMSEEEIQKAIYEKYYASWTEDDMMVKINERSSFYQKSAFFDEVIDYLENVREMRDIANVVEPLYYTDMKYYSENDFKDVPPLMVHIAKNEIYARYGYIFKNEDLYNYFMGCIWYNPTCTSKQFDDSVFNQYEKANLELLAGLDTY